MLSFKEYQLDEEQTPLQKAQTAVLAGDYESALKHLKNHVPDKNRRTDAFVAKLKYTIHKNLKQ